LHLASNQKEAGQSALAGIARLVAASRWAIFVTTRTGGVDSLSFEPLVARSISDGAALRFDEVWRRELLSDAEIHNEPESKSARTAGKRNETIKKIERGQWVVAVPLSAVREFLACWKVCAPARAHDSFRQRKPSCRRPWQFRSPRPWP